MSAHIVFLNGASSAGKTSIAGWIQNLATVGYFMTGWDHMAQALRLDVNRISNDTDEPSEHPWFEWVMSTTRPGLTDFRIGMLGRTLMTTMHRSAAELVRSGINVLVDDVFFDQEVVRSTVEIFDGLPVWYVGIRCPVDVVEAREVARGDRMVGLGRVLSEVVHTFGPYDIEVETSQVSARQGAERILAAIGSGARPSAFARMLDADRD
jgi:chloramphenicol 3-O phosphotransferase